MSEEKKDGGCAFPCPGNSWSKGMTLRDYFAAKAMQSQIIADEGIFSGAQATEVAVTAYAMADEMLKAREE